MNRAAFYLAIERRSAELREGMVFKEDREWKQDIVSKECIVSGKGYSWDLSGRESH